MRVKVVSVRCFEVLTPDGKSHGLFKVDSEWKGLVCLRSITNPDQVLIGDPNDPPLARVLDAMFGEHRGDLEVVKASPAIGPEIVNRQDAT